MSTESDVLEKGPEIGKAIAGEIDFQIQKPAVTIPKRAEVVPFVRGLVAEEDEHGNPIVIESEWIQKGRFFIDTRKQTNDDDGLVILTVHGFDAMMFAEDDYESSLSWPAWDYDVVAEIAAQMGVALDSRTVDIMKNGDETSPGTYQLQAAPIGYTKREVLGFIASMYVGNFVMSDLGELRLLTLLEMPAETNHLIDEHGYAITFGGVEIIV